MNSLNLSHLGLYSLSQKQLNKSLSPSLKLVLDFIINKNLSPVIIGGVVRDFFLNGSWGCDWDVEVWDICSEREHFWVKNFAKIKEELEVLLSRSHASFEIEILPFSILKIQVEEIAIEISPARKELYKGPGPFGHAEFEVTSLFGSCYKEPFLRRDFSVNAIGIELLREQTDYFSYKLQDPLEGLNDLKKRILRPCHSSQFYLDPVRMLRMIRFHLLFKFSYDKDIDVSKFELKKLSPFYLLKEGRKSCDVTFFRLFFKLCYEYQLEINAKIRSLSPLVYLTKPYQNQELAFVDLLVHSNETGLSYIRLDKLGHILGLKKSWFQSLIRLKKYENYWKNFKLDDISRDFKSRSLSDTLNDLFFERFFSSRPGFLIIQNNQELLDAFDFKLVINQVRLLLEKNSAQEFREAQKLAERNHLQAIEIPKILIILKLRAQV